MLCPKKNAVLIRKNQDQPQTLTLKTSTDKLNMGRFLEFADLLEAKIRREIRDEKIVKTPRFSSETESFPVGMAWLMGNVDSRVSTFTPNTSRARSAYGVRVKPRAPHKFDATQTQSFEFLKTYVSELDFGFSPRELKSAYRKAAMILHPDQGGTNEKFRDLHRHFENLRRIFHAKTESKARKNQ
jgi:hypothetical protein